MTKLRQLVENTGVGIIAISHIRRGNKQKSFNEGEMISLTDLRGSASIEQLSDIVLASERDQQADDETSDIAQLRQLKNRPCGEVGPCGHVKYHTDTGRLLPCDFEQTDTTKDIAFDEVSDI